MPHENLELPQLDQPSNPEQLADYNKAMENARAEGATDFKVMFAAEAQGENVDPTSGKTNPNERIIFNWTEADELTDMGDSEKPTNIKYALVAVFPQESTTENA